MDTNQEVKVLRDEIIQIESSIESAKNEKYDDMSWHAYTYAPSHNLCGSVDLACAIYRPQIFMSIDHFII